MARSIAYLAGSSNGPVGLSAIDADTGAAIDGFVPLGNMYQVLALNCTEVALLPGGQLACVGMFIAHSVKPADPEDVPSVQAGLVLLDALTGELIAAAATADFPPTSAGRLSVGADGAVFATAGTPMLYKFDAGLGLVWSVSAGSRLGDIEDMGEMIAVADEGAATVRMLSKETGIASDAWTLPTTPWGLESCIKAFAGGLAVNSSTDAANNHIGVTVLTATGEVNTAFSVADITRSIGSSDAALAVAGGYLHYPFLFIDGGAPRWDVARVDAAGNVDIAYTFTPKFAAGRHLAAPLLLAPSGDGLIVKTSVSGESDDPQLLRLDADGTAHAGYTPPQALPVYLLAELAAPDPEPEPEPKPPHVINHVLRGYAGADSALSAWIRSEAGPLDLSGSSLLVRIKSYKGHVISSYPAIGTAGGEMTCTIPEEFGRLNGAGVYRFDVLDAATGVIAIGILEVV